jgi:hypothetical protein
MTSGTYVEGENLFYVNGDRILEIGLIWLRQLRMLRIGQGG